jgi:LuxR family transcriptional regulator, maltose regulon positive regulatory protein
MGVHEAQRAAPLGVNASQDHRPELARWAVPPPLLATKLAIPSPALSLVARPRLTARLEHAGCRVVLVVAPAGSGKSSLVSQWSQEYAPGRVAWLSLDAHDNNPTRFVRYLCGALETVAPEAAEPARVLVEWSEPPPLDEVLTVLLNGLAALSEPVTLVLDDYHHIEADLVHQLVAFLIDHLPPTLFLILISRRDPPLPLARLRARGELVELRAVDLRFTREEAHCFLNECIGLALAPEAVARLTERTEGWITGLQLAALSLRKHPDPAQFLASFSGTHRHLVDYLVEEVLQRQPEPVQRFLWETAILERMCAPLCEAVTGRPGGQAMLEQLEAANLFLIPLDEERHWYRYHHLFAEAVRVRVRPQPRGAAPVATLHERASIWHETVGLIEEALEHALASGQTERVARLIEQHFAAMTKRGETRQPERYLQALPTELIQTRPLLSLALAVVYIHDFRFEEAQQLLDSGRFELRDTGAGGAEGASWGPGPGRFGREADSGGGSPLPDQGKRKRAPGPEGRDLRGKLLMLRGICAGTNETAERAATLSTQALEWLAPANLVWRCGALISLATARAQRGELEEAAPQFVEGIELSLKCDNLLGVVRASHSYGQLCESQGGLGEAERIYRTAVEYARRRRRLHVPRVGPLLAALGRLCYQRNDLAGATAYLEAALRSIRCEFTGSDTPHAVVCYIELHRLQTARGETAAASETLAQLAAAIRPHTARFFEPLVALLRVRQPGTTAAEVDAWLAAFEAPGRPEAPTALPFPGLWLPETSSLEMVTWAKLRLARGEGPPVVPRLEAYLEQQVAAGRHGNALPVCALLSILYWQARRQDRAVTVLEPALALAEREGHVRDFLDTGAGLVPVLRYCEAQGIAAGWSRQLLAAWEATHPVGEKPCEGAAREPREPLSEREREVLRLLAQGLSNEQIAAQLFLSVLTVKRHLHHIYGKLEVTSRFGAVTRGRELRLV